MPEIVVTESAERDIKRLAKEVKLRVAAKLEQLAIDPVPLSRRLVNSDLGSYRSRVGDYRIVFDLIGNDLIVLRVGHRREVYK